MYMYIYYVYNYLGTVKNMKCNIKTKPHCIGSCHTHNTQYRSASFFLNPRDKTGTVHMGDGAERGREGEVRGEVVRRRSEGGEVVRRRSEGEKW